ncbi:hypothetical protein FSP39_013058 [Pinctada imbricata]|uniref:Uncharacterized protein n=1 Tax=Pinctada imbricata TaxID=66713 RepID=A0AA88YJU6_PINIB|nr:hypothetical protein FSP39_013058 [Pinctada imbricata]
MSKKGEDLQQHLVAAPTATSQNIHLLNTERDAVVQGTSNPIKHKTQMTTHKPTRPKGKRYTYRYYRTSYYYYYSYTGSSYSGSTTGIVVGSIIAGVLIAGTVLFICWLCKKRRRSQSTSGRVIQTSNVTSISPPRVVGTVNPNVVTYTTQEGNIAYAPALNPPKYETVVTNGSADSTGQSYGQPPPYPVTTGTETHGQQDDHVTHDTAKLVKD